MYLLRLPLACLVLLATVGCGPSGESVKEQQVDPTQEIRSGLEQAVKTGAVGSEIFSAIEKLKETDAAKAETLEKGCSEMMSMRDRNQVIAKAKELLGTLGGASSGGGGESSGQ